MTSKQKSQTNAAVVLGGMALAAVASLCGGEQSSACVTAVGGLLSFVGGVAGNQAHAWLSSEVDARPTDPEDLFRNHHLRDLIGIAGQTVLRDVAAKSGGNPSGSMQQAIRGWPEALNQALETPASPLVQLGEFHLPDLLSAFAKQEGKLPLLTPEIWQDFLQQSFPKLWPDENRLAAQALHQRLGEALWNHVKLDASRDGPAYAAIELLYLSRILHAVEQRPGGSPAPDATAMEARVAELIRQLDKKHAGFFERLFAQNGSLLELVKNQKRLLEKLPSDVADELERRRLLKPVFEFRADLSRIVKYAPADLIGRDAELKLLNDAWFGSAELPLRPDIGAAQQRRPPWVNILAFVALGGEGKTSLVAKWAADLAAQGWPGCDAVFAWSFYSQGTREQTAVSSDLFLAEALTFFGDESMAKSAAGGFDKGRRLAQLVGERRALLILDGLEPLQYAPTSPTPGELKDQGLAALLKGLAATSHGLCIVTTRYALPDLHAFHGKTVREEKLTRLACAAGVQLLKAHGVTGSDRPNLPHTDAAGESEMLSEFEKLVEDVDGHALTLHLMGSFLKRAFQGDIRRRDRVTFARADQKTDNGHAFRAMAAYEKWLADDSEEARRELALLSLMGLFDRPATADCLQALLQAPAIAGLTEALVGLPEEDWNGSLTALQDARLLTVSPKTVSLPNSPFPIPATLDAHPLLREYFAMRLKTGSAGVSPASTARAVGESRRDAGAPGAAWREAHRRLYEHLCATTKEGDQPTLEDLQPLYQAVAHGCQAGLQQEACDKVYFARIQKGNEHYAWHKLGAYGPELGAQTCLFETPWSRVSPALAEADQAWLLNEAAFTLRALGRLTEALEPFRAGLEMRIRQAHWMGAASQASNLSELELTLGQIDGPAGAVGAAEQSVTYADCSGDAGWAMFARTTHADALHQAGRRAEAEARFREAEQIQAKLQPAYPLLYSLQGFRYCDLLLTAAEREAGLTVLGRAELPLRPDIGVALQRHPTLTLESCRAVSERAAQIQKRRTGLSTYSLLDIALDHLTLGRAALYAAGLSSDTAAVSSFSLPTSHLSRSVSGLRRAGTQQYLPLGLLTRAWLRSLTGVRTGPESAQSDLDEAWEIAARGPMPLFLADIHLYRARLFFREPKYPWESPQHDLAEARRLIFKHGYLRRKEELEDAEAAILGTTSMASGER